MCLSRAFSTAVWRMTTSGIPIAENYMGLRENHKLTLFVILI